MVTRNVLPHSALALNKAFLRLFTMGPTICALPALGKRLMQIMLKRVLKLLPLRADVSSMSTKNELIDVINSARANGNDVKCIRPQKYDPNNVYMTLVQGGKQVGPVKVEGNMDELNRKFSEAQTYLEGMKNNPTNRRANAA